MIRNMLGKASRVVYGATDDEQHGSATYDGNNYSHHRNDDDDDDDVYYDGVPTNPGTEEFDEHELHAHAAALSLRAQLRAAMHYAPCVKALLLLLVPLCVVLLVSRPLSHTHAHAGDTTAAAGAAARPPLRVVHAQQALCFAMALLLLVPCNVLVVELLQDVVANWDSVPLGVVVGVLFEHTPLLLYSVCALVVAAATTDDDIGDVASRHARARVVCMVKPAVLGAVLLHLLVVLGGSIVVAPTTAASVAAAAAAAAAAITLPSPSTHELQQLQPQPLLTTSTTPSPLPPLRTTGTTTPASMSTPRTVVNAYGATTTTTTTNAATAAAAATGALLPTTMSSCWATWSSYAHGVVFATALLLLPSIYAMTVTSTWPDMAQQQQQEQHVAQATRRLLIVSRTLALLVLVVYALHALRALRLHRLHGYTTSSSPRHHHHYYYNSYYYHLHSYASPDGVHALCNLSTALQYGEAVRHGAHTALYRSSSSSSSSVTTAAAAAATAAAATMGAEPRFTTRFAFVAAAVLVALQACLCYVVVACLRGAAATLRLPLPALLVIVVPCVCEAATLAACLLFARNGRLDVSTSAALRSVVYLLLCLLPCLVVLAWLLRVPLDLVFPPFLACSCVLAVLVVCVVLAWQRVRWLEGAMLLVVYGVVACASALGGWHVCRSSTGMYA